MKKWKRTAIILAAALTITGFPAVAEKPVKAGVYDVKNPVITDEKNTWDTLTFGRYWQEDTNGDTVTNQEDSKQPIRWRVLSVNGEDAFLMSEKTLDNQCYNEPKTTEPGVGLEPATWETCSLRTWLNETFLKEAFTEEEQAAILDTKVVTSDEAPWGAAVDGGNDTIDKVYLPSIEEITDTSYGFDTQQGFRDSSDWEKYRLSQTIASTNTTYAMAQGAKRYEESEARDEYPFEKRAVGSTYYWWLRSPGWSERASAIVLIGIVSTSGAEHNDRYGVRPVLHLNLSKTSLWTKGEPVSAENDGYAKMDESSPSPSATGIPSSDPEETPGIRPTASPAATISTTQAPTASPEMELPATKAPKEPPKTIGSMPTQTPASTDKPVIQSSEQNQVPISKMGKIGKAKIAAAKNIKGKKIQITWKKVKEAASYDVQYGIGKKMTKGKKISTEKTRLTIKKLRKNKSYYIRVRACDAKGNKGTWSAMKKVKIKK